MPKNTLRPLRIEGENCFITLTKGYEAVVDADDAIQVAGHSWFADVRLRSDKSVKVVYAVCNVRRDDGLVGTVMLHRHLAGQQGVQVDHVDLDGLNNRRNNLRAASAQQNRCNQRAHVDGAVGIKGVSLHKASGKLRATIGSAGKVKHLGLFDSVSEAAAAYAKASAEEHGAFGRVS